MDVRAVVALALVASALVVAPSAQAEPYANVGFTVIVEDAADFPASGFLDVREIAVGEPGDDSAVFRILAEDQTDVPPATASIHLWFSTEAGSFRSGVDSSGAPTSTNPFDACETIEPYFYCTMTYQTLGTSVGGSISGMYVITYLSVAQDYAPGLLYADACLAQCLAGIQERGDDYVLVGSTVIEDEGAPGPALFYEDLSGDTAAISATFEAPTDDTYVYDWTTDYTDVTISYVGQVEAGNATFTIADGEGMEVASGTISEGANTTTASDAAPGNWTITIEYEGFQGSVDLTITETSEDPGPGGSGSGGTGGTGGTGGSGGTGGTGGESGGSDDGTNETADPQEGEKKSPGLAPLLVLVGLVVWAARRR